MLQSILLGAVSSGVNVRCAGVLCFAAPPWWFLPLFPLFPIGPPSPPPGRPGRREVGAEGDGVAAHFCDRSARRRRECSARWRAASSGVEAPGRGRWALGARARRKGGGQGGRGTGKGQGNGGGSVRGRGGKVAASSRRGPSFGRAPHVVAVVGVWGALRGNLTHHIF